MLKSSIVAKVVVAISGLLLFLFVVGHMAGNLQVFLGPEALNWYAHKLKSMPALLWTARIGLLVLATLHVVFTVKLVMANRVARPDSYVYEDTLKASIASRTMIYTGLVVLAFILYHLAHFTMQAVNIPAELAHHEPMGSKQEQVLMAHTDPAKAAPTGTAADLIQNAALGNAVVNPSSPLATPFVTKESPTAELLKQPTYKLADGHMTYNVYAMVIRSFQNPLVALTYIIANFLLGLHLSHGVSSMFQTLGLKTPRTRPLLNLLGPIAAIVIVAGNVGIPLAIWVGAIPRLHG